MNAISFDSLLVQFVDGSDVAEDDTVFATGEVLGNLQIVFSLSICFRWV